MNHEEQQVLNLYRELLDQPLRMDRTGTGTRAVFGRTLKFDVGQSFPLITTKFVPSKSVLAELLWFIEGSSDERRLAEILHGSRDEHLKTIWTLNANAPYWKDKAKFNGDLGRIYGVQWRSWGVGQVDQLANIINTIKTNPTDRRMVMTAWNPGELHLMALPPCHMFCQFFVDIENKKLNLNMYQRSVDTFLGLPFNIASYALLLEMVASVTGLKPGELTMMLGDTHLYANHEDQVRIQLQREPYPFPRLKINPAKSIDDFKMDDFDLIDYKSHPKIQGWMAV